MTISGSTELEGDGPPTLKQLRRMIPELPVLHLIRTLLSAGHSADGAVGAVVDWLGSVGVRDSATLRAGLAVWAAVESSRMKPPNNTLIRRNPPPVLGDLEPIPLPPPKGER